MHITDTLNSRPYCMIPKLLYELSKSVTYIILNFNIRAIQYC